MKKKKLIINAMCVVLSVLIVFAGVMMLRLLLEKEKKFMAEQTGRISAEDSSPISFADNERRPVLYDDIYRRAFALNGYIVKQTGEPLDGELSMMDATVSAMREYYILAGQGCVPDIDWSPFQVVSSEYVVCEFYGDQGIPPETFGLWAIEFQSRRSEEMLLIIVDGRTGRIFSLNANMKSRLLESAENIAESFAKYLDVNEADIIVDDYSYPAEEAYRDADESVFFRSETTCYVKDVEVRGSCIWEAEMMYISIYLNII